MDILPEEVPTLEFFTPEELREFQDDRFVALQEDAKKNTAETYGKLKGAIGAMLKASGLPAIGGCNSLKQVSDWREIGEHRGTYTHSRWSLS